jgi:DNA-binding MarR family transcriptional regulator
MAHLDRPAIKTMAKGLRAQARNPRVKVFLSYLYTSDIVNKYLDSALAHEKVTRAGFSVLHFLILNGGSMIPTTISKKTARSKYSVTRVVDTLEKMGLVERLSSGGDRRTRRIGITPRGLETVKNATLASREALCNDIFRTLSEKDIVELDNVLRGVRKNVLCLLESKAAGGDSEE